MPESRICQVCLKYFDSLDIMEIWDINYCKSCRKKWEKEQTTFNKIKFNHEISRRVRNHIEQIEECYKQKYCKHKWTSPYENYGTVRCEKCDVMIDGH